MNMLITIKEAAFRVASFFHKIKIKHFIRRKNMI